MKSENPTPLRFLDKALALMGLTTCLLVVVWSSKMIASQQSLWLLPGLYLVEMVAVSSLAVHGAFRGTREGVAEIWMAAGVLLGFALMGVWSIGLCFIPSTLLFIAAALLSNWGQTRYHVIEYAVIIVFACICQITLMIVIIRSF